MIFTDRIHIVSDRGLKELHQFASLLGLNPCWFDSNPNHPHYDFPKVHSNGIPRDQLIEDAITLGATEVSTREIAEIAIKLRGSKRYY